MTSDGPQDPFEGLAATAVQMHEMYAIFVSAGFTSDQSMQIIQALLLETLRLGLSG